MKKVLKLLFKEAELKAFKKIKWFWMRTWLWKWKII